MSAEWPQIVALTVGAGLALSAFLALMRPRNRAAAAAQRAIHDAIKAAPPELGLSALDLAAALRAGELTCEEAVRMHVEHARAVNPHLNALVGERYEAALAEARAADDKLARWRAGDGAAEALPPLLGVPFVSKEVFEYPGMPYTAGIPGRRHVVGERRNPVLARLEAAGAIVLACGNTSEGCMWAESANPVHGRSSNPHDVTRTPGGSSGGNAAAVASLVGAFTVTSDVGGSTRIPSLYNGLFGHKPTGGAVPNTRTAPTVHGRVERFCQLGPTSRTARDLLPLLRLMAGPCEADELEDATAEEKSHLAAQRGFMRELKWPTGPALDHARRLRYFVVWEQPGAVLGTVHARHPDMLAAQQRVVEALKREIGAEVSEIKLPAMASCFDMWMAMLNDANPVPFAEVISEGKAKIWPGWELFKWLASGGTMSQHSLPALGLAATEGLAKLTTGRNRMMRERCEALRKELNDLLGKDGVLVFPSLPVPAPTHGPLPNLLFFADFAACGIFNTLELPATAVPCGLASQGLPVGVQLVAAEGNDHLTLAVAEALETWGVARFEPPAAAGKS